MNKNNLLLHSDNLAALNYLLNSGFKGKIDLVYIDPPYATGGNFTITNGRYLHIDYKICHTLLNITIPSFTYIIYKPA
jgi:16S rRNA G966 N2-methylase RsmD